MLREESSRWDPTKEAQYEVLGNDAKKISVPLGTIEGMTLGPSHAASPM
jgi:hypothetical protein